MFPFSVATVFALQIDIICQEHSVTSNTRSCWANHTASLSLCLVLSVLPGAASPPLPREESIHILPYDIFARKQVVRHGEIIDVT